jgi:glucose-1-phosphate thymidylyltransferase
LPIANKPIVEYVLEHICRINIKEVGVILAPETQQEVKSYFDNCELVRSNNIAVTYILQDQPAGLAHAVKVSRGFLKDDPFIMCLGDNLLKDPMTGGLELFRQNELDAMVFLKEVEDPRAFGVAILDDKGSIKQLIEKPAVPPSKLALVGFYMFSPKIHQAIDRIKPSARGELEITDAIQELIDMGSKVEGTVLKDWWLDTGKKDDILSANTIILDEYVQKTVKGKIDEQSKITGRVFIDTDAEIINSTIRGPVMIGRNAKIENSFIGPFTTIGDQTCINQSTIEHCVILNKVTIDGISRLEDSLIGEETRVTDGKRKTLRMMIGDSAIVEV